MVLLQTLIPDIRDISPRELTPYCGFDHLGPVKDAKACKVYLLKGGTTDCKVPGLSSTTFCTSGKAKVTGQSGNDQDQISYCRDVSAGLNWVMNNDKRGKKVTGFNAAAGMEICGLGL